jgi:aspartyl-tRNA(Asn)/glutamyl-tRNA(Gln) amidotransferase subunit A
MRTAIEIRDAIAKKETTARAVITEVLRDIHARDEQIGAFLETFDNEALETADRIDALVASGEPLPHLAGVPVAIKDNLLYKGHVASAGSKMLEHYTSSYTATAVQRLIDAGAIIVGRTNMDEFAAGSSTETSAYKKTRNPHDLTKIPGGSSGGSAAAVSAGFVPVSLGSDTGGSIRQPASVCGIVGMKPSYGAVSRYGLMAMASSLDQIGPFATTVADATLVLDVISGKDPFDATSFDADKMTNEGSEEPSLKGVRVGVPKEYFIDGMDESIKAIIHGQIERMRSAGAEIIDLSLPLTEYALPVYYIIQPAEMSSNLGRYDGFRYGDRAQGTLKESLLNARKFGFGPEVKRRIMLGTFILSSGYYDAYYKKALAVRSAIFAEMNEAFKRVDVIVTPTSPTVAWNIGEKFNDPLAMYLADIYTTTANIAGLPAVSLPAGKAHDLPVGIQFMAPHKHDAQLLKVAEAFERL